MLKRIIKWLHFSFLTVFHPLAVLIYSFGVKKTVSASKCEQPLFFAEKSLTAEEVKKISIHESIEKKVRHIDFL